jgi:hypothetical protein
MKNLDLIAEELFNKIRGRFPSVTLGDAEGKVTNVPTDARFFDFDYKEGDINLGKVSVSLGENSVEIMYSDNFVSEQDDVTKENWYNFLKEMRQFSKKRLMTFDTRNINKSNLDKRDYKFLAQNRGEETMSESKMYGTNRVSYQKVDGARLVVKHTESVNTEIAGGRTRSIGKIYIESADGERFMYPFKHLSGARAMARHVAEGGKPFDEFGTHIVGLSEEMNKLRKFKNYMGRSAVMAESLAGYTDVVNDRIKSVKKTIESLQKPSYYAEAIGSFEAAVMEDVPADVKENWIDQLTIKQFNEELSDVFPYIYKLVSEATKAKELTAADLLGEEDGGIFRAGMEVPQDVDGASAPATSPRPKARPSDLGNAQPADSYVVKPGDTIWSIADRFAASNYDGDTKAGAKDILELNGITDPRSLQPGQKLEIGYFMGDMQSGGTRGLPPGGFKSYESQLEDSFDELMGQFAESKDSEVEEEKAVEEQKTPVTEFVLSMFDRETGQFPKGETAILTAVEKDYGEQYINPAKAFIEAINAKYEELNVQSNPIVDDFGFENTGTVMEPTVEQEEEMDEGGIDDVRVTSRRPGRDPERDASYTGPSYSQTTNYDDYKNEFDELEALMGMTAFSNEQLMRRNLLAKKYGIRRPADLAAKRKEFNADLATRNQTRWNNQDARNAQAEKEHRAEMMKLAPQFFNADGTPNIDAWKAAGSPTPSQLIKRMGAGKSSETGFSLPRQGARESEDLTSIKRLAGL